ncbi:hypothetical protein FHW20_004511 [Ochrobactrum intermedium]|uniref:Uncharacterized protein n=1 Tax=Brucella intermedia TaxID=94625 RepID=A0ABR6AVM8_9HYPH|nr:hypothetical protein [Brucella intermedia]
MGENRHYDGNRCLVVCSQNTRAIASDDVLILPAANFRMLVNTKPDIGFTVQANVAAREAVDRGSDFRRQSNIGRIEMRDKSDTWATGTLPPQKRCYDCLIVYDHILKPELLQFGGQQASQLKLAGRRRQFRRRDIALAWYRKIAEKSFCQFLIGSHDDGAFRC